MIMITPKRHWDHLGPTIPNNLKKIVRTKIVHTSGTFLEKMFKDLFKTCSYINKIQRIRIPYSKYQFIIQNTPKILKYFRRKYVVRTFRKNKKKT